MLKIFALIVAALVLLFQAPSAKAQWTAEVQWTEVPCSVSRLSGPDGMTCLRGPDTEGGTGSGKCIYKRDAMFGSYQRGFVYSDIYQSWHQRCWIGATWINARGTKATSAAAMQDLAGSVFSEAGHGNWTDVRIVENAFVSEFVSSKRRCVAFQNYGPPYLAGYRHVVTGFACDSPESRTEDAAFTDDEIKLRMALIRSKW